MEISLFMDGNYKADMLAAKRRCVVELDGSDHLARALFLDGDGLRDQGWICVVDRLAVGRAISCIGHHFTGVHFQVAGIDLADIVDVALIVIEFSSGIISR
jgi:hypothetical protein